MNSDNVEEPTPLPLLGVAQWSVIRAFLRHPLGVVPVAAHDSAPPPPSPARLDSNSRQTDLDYYEEHSFWSLIHRDL